MVRPLHQEIEHLKKKILYFCALVEENVRNSIASLVNRDSRLAKKVIETDSHIDRMEIEVEEDCLKIIALHQPVASDLRFIIAVFNINNDLERIGDLAVNIAESALYLASCPQIVIPFDYPGMAEKALAMLNKSLDALVNLDPDLAREVCLADEEVDEINQEMYLQVEESIRRYPERLDCLILFPAISGELERIADHATNIAEEVIYLAEGRIVRHQNVAPQKPNPGSSKVGDVAKLLK